MIDTFIQAVLDNYNDCVELDDNNNIVFIPRRNIIFSFGDTENRKRFFLSGHALNSLYKRFKDNDLDWWKNFLGQTSNVIDKFVENPRKKGKVKKGFSITYSKIQKGFIIVTSNNIRMVFTRKNPSRHNGHFYDIKTQKFIEVKDDKPRNILITCYFDSKSDNFRKSLKYYR